MYPVADSQVGASGFDEFAFAEHVDEILADSGARILGVGDYIDGVSPSNRKLLRAAQAENKLYDTAIEMYKAAALDQVDEFLRLVEGTQGKWDAVLGGHHMSEYTERLPSGLHVVRTTDHDIADAVGAPYLSEPGDKLNMALVSYRFPRMKGGKRPVLRVLMLHGQGGTSTWAAPLNQLEKLARAFTAHVYLIAHHHKLVAARMVKLESSSRAATRLQATDAVLVAAGSWLRGYMLDETTYAEDGMMAPLATGAPIIRARVRDNGTFRIRVEV